MAGYREVRRFTMPPGQEPGAVKGMADQVRALAWSPDGRMIAAGGGTPGAFGELVLIDAATGSVVRTLEGHRDYVYHVAFSPDGKRLASCGYDKLIRIWDTATGKPTGVLKEHTEAVYAVAFNASGTLLASASADRSIKIWDVAKGVRLYTINDPTDAVLTLAFRPGTDDLFAGGADKRLRAWTISDTSATSIGNTLAHTAGIIRLAFSPDGARLATSSTDRQVKLWSAADLRELRQFGEQSDWAQSLAFSRDGDRAGGGAIRWHGQRLRRRDRRTGCRVDRDCGLPAPESPKRAKVGRHRSKVREVRQVRGCPMTRCMRIARDGNCCRVLTAASAAAQVRPPVLTSVTPYGHPARHDGDAHARGREHRECGSGRCSIDARPLGDDRRIQGSWRRRAQARCRARPARSSRTRPRRRRLPSPCPPAPTCRSGGRGFASARRSARPA